MALSLDSREKELRSLPRWDDLASDNCSVRGLSSRSPVSRVPSTTPSLGDPSTRGLRSMSVTKWGWTRIRAPPVEERVPPSWREGRKGPTQPPLRRCLFSLTPSTCETGSGDMILIVERF